ncbi:phosphatidylinositol N-acetylglucosaminyltransferase subunit H-like isoform X1 [Littorina saxatilis]|uniref:phosphatidylinositol N-acetylglucosaminyltransferase subunit H-like isoform X1 n=1 Tax=Littorina saxatilis TaxID=31220 RepID=UPI0038B4E152
MEKMANLEHRNYGAMGSEFILHHCALRPKRLVASFVVTTTLCAALKLHEMNVRLLWLLSVVLALVLAVRLFNKVRKEVLLVLPNLGVQVKTQYWFRHQETQFFDKSRVKGIVITEAVTMQSIVCYLAVLLASTPVFQQSIVCYLAVLLASRPAGPVETVVPLFTRSWPRLQDLVYMYRAVEDTCTDSVITSVHQDSKGEEETQQLGARDTTRVRSSQEESRWKKKRLPLRSRRTTRSSKS